MKEIGPGANAVLGPAVPGGGGPIRGRLKVFLGAAAGVGKTYAMLEAAQKLRRDKVDVVAGIVETHGSPETEALLEGIEILPVRRTDYRGTGTKEFDLDAAIARR